MPREAKTWGVDWVRLYRRSESCSGFGNFSAASVVGLSMNKPRLAVIHINNKSITLVGVHSPG